MRSAYHTRTIMHTHTAINHDTRLATKRQPVGRRDVDCLSHIGTVVESGAMIKADTHTRTSLTRNEMRQEM
jgi:hypothetical protein